MFKKILRRILPEKILEVYRRREEIYMRIGSKSKALSNSYYTLISDEFGREHRAVLAGKVKYLNDVDSEKSSIYQLIRNTHRIEKGLLMKPRRSVFAEHYIKETVDCFEKHLQKHSTNEFSQIKWSQDVLSNYFEVTSGSYIVEKQHKRFNRILRNQAVESDRNSIPYHNKKISNIHYDDFYKLALQRRSTRWFRNKKVPRELIDKAILAAIQSPSACNRQPFEYRVIDDEKLVKEIAHLPGGTSGYADNIPLMIVAVGNLDAYFSDKDRHLIYIDTSLANMSLMLALETLGLSSCAINWHDIEKRETKMAELLNLEKYQRTIMCIAVGFADPEGMVAFSEKKNLNIIRKYN